MQVHICSPYRVDKNLAKAYNDAMQRIGEDDWNCFHDIDVTFLTPDSGAILEEYARRFSDAGIFTCYTNRVSSLSIPQLLGGKVSENRDILHHIELAEKQKSRLYNVTTIDQDISGMVMMISKKMWNQFQFEENRKCLLVDTYYGRRLRNAGKMILRMDGLYVFHIYRMLNGVKDKTHLI